MAACICDSLASFLPPCQGNQPGGNYLKISIVPSCYIDTITTIGGTGTDANVISAITLDTVNNPGAIWYTIDARKDTVLTLEDQVVPGNFVNQTISFTIANYSNNIDKETAAQEQSDFVNLLVSSTEGFVIVARDKSGTRKLYGATNPLYVTVMQKTSGTVTTDLAGTSLTFSEAQPVLAPALEFAVGGTGLIPGK